MSFRMHEGDPVFMLACELANGSRGANPKTEPTRRQWSKWRRGFGSARRFAEEAKRLHEAKNKAS